MEYRDLLQHFPQRIVLNWGRGRDGLGGLGLRQGLLAFRLRGRLGLLTDLGGGNRAGNRVDLDVQASLPNLLLAVRVTVVSLERGLERPRGIFSHAIPVAVKFKILR